MRHTVNKAEKQAEDGSLTYIDGLGFISVNNRLRYLNSLRHASSFFCCMILVYFLATQALVRPFIYLFYYLGMNITINLSTGWIEMSDYINASVLFSVHLVVVLLILALTALVYRTAFLNAPIFRPAQKGVMMIGVPVIIAFGLLGEIVGMMLGEFTETFGYVFSTHTSEKSLSLDVFFLQVILTLVISLLLEVFLRGMALTVLRRYGDGFAIFACAILSVLMAKDLQEAASVFVFSLCAGYFVIRGGSLHTALFARGGCDLIRSLFHFVRNMLEPSLAEVICLVSCVLILAIAFLCCIHFIRVDQNAFRLIHPNDHTTNRLKFANFCSTFFFFVLLFLLLIRVFESVQIIG